MKFKISTLDWQTQATKLKASEKSKTAKIVNKIQSGTFDENDVDNLYMKLRAYSSGFSIFQEVAGFVAHNNERNRGIASNALETMYLRMKFFLEYNSPKKSLDLSSPFPSWIKKLMKLQIDKLTEEDFKNKFGISRQVLKTRIDRIFKEDKTTKMVSLRVQQIPESTLEGIQHAMGFISGTAAFSQAELIEEIVSVIQKNTISIDEDAFKANGDKLMLATLYLIHNTKFNFGGHKAGTCQISSEKSSISYNTRFVDQEGSEVDHEESFGNLYISGSVEVTNKGTDQSILHSVVSSDLKVDEWCHQSMFSIEPMSEETPNYLCRRVNWDRDLVLTNDFKLAYA